MDSYQQRHESMVKLLNLVAAKQIKLVFIPYSRGQGLIYEILHRLPRSPDVASVQMYELQPSLEEFLKALKTHKDGIIHLGLGDDPLKPELSNLIKTALNGTVKYQLINRMPENFQFTGSFIITGYNMNVIDEGLRVYSAIVNMTN